MSTRCKAALICQLKRPLHAQTVNREPAKLEHADEVQGQLGSPPVARVEATNELAQNLPPQQVLEALPSLREELKVHCCLCRQWTPKRGGTKLHMRGTRQQEWNAYGKAAEAECLKHADLITSHGGCPFCQEPHFAVKRAARARASKCQVLFQIIFMKVRQETPCVPQSSRVSITRHDGAELQLCVPPPVPVAEKPTPTQAEFLLRHCCICGREQPNLRSLKTHMHKSHKEIWIDTDELSRDCKQFLTTADKTCPYCNKTSRIAKDHAPFCPVIFQHCLIAKLHCPGLTHDGAEEEEDQAEVGKKRQRPAPEPARTTGKGKGKGKMRNNWARGGWQKQDTDMEEALNAMAKLCLRQETECTCKRQRVE